MQIFNSGLHPYRCMWRRNNSLQQRIGKYSNWYVKSTSKHCRYEWTCKSLSKSLHKQFARFTNMECSQHICGKEGLKQPPKLSLLSAWPTLHLVAHHVQSEVFTTVRRRPFRNRVALSVLMRRLRLQHVLKHNNIKHGWILEFQK